MKINIMTILYYVVIVTQLSMVSFNNYSYCKNANVVVDTIKDDTNDTIKDENGDIINKQSDTITHYQINNQNSITDAYFLTSQNFWGCI